MPKFKHVSFLHVSSFVLSRDYIINCGTFVRIGLNMTFMFYSVEQAEADNGILFQNFVVKSVFLTNFFATMAGTPSVPKCRLF